MLRYFFLLERSPKKVSFFKIIHQIKIFTLVGSLKSGRSRKSTADKPSAIQITNPSSKKHQEYFTRNVEYL
jgi:hypothetical protein